MILLLLIGCATDYRYPTQARDLWSGQIADVDIAIEAQLLGRHTAGHYSSGWDWVPAHDNHIVAANITASRSGNPVVRYDLNTPAQQVVPDDKAGAQRSFDALPTAFCPVEEGLVFRFGDSWFGLWSLSGVLLQSQLPLSGDRCEQLHPPGRVSWLSANPSSATTCRLLDDAGFREAAVRCLLVARDDDLSPAALPMGPKAGRARPVSGSDYEQLRQRIIADPEATKLLENLVLDGQITTVSVLEVQLIAKMIEASGRRDSFLQRVIGRCADPEQVCEPGALEVASWNLITHGWSSVTPEECATAARAIQPLLDREDEEGIRSAYSIGRRVFMCDPPAMRSLALAGLDIPTTADRTLKSPSYSSYGSSTHACAPQVRADRTLVGPDCESLPRFAGTWLALHCDAEAIERARAVAASRPQQPFDPREDQRLDGALRVLGACDEAAFEAAIAPMPDTVPSTVNIRSKENLRKVFLGPPHFNL